MGRKGFVLKIVQQTPAEILSELKGLEHRINCGDAVDWVVYAF
jgi:hypothetical protein